MTLVVGALSHKTGVVCLAADSKVTWTNDETKTRQIYTEPTLKVILLGDDVAVGLAGSGPDALARNIEGQRGEPIEQILDSLRKVDEAAFVVAQRSPTRLWMVSAERGIEDRTDIGRAWAGDASAFNAFPQRFEDFADAEVAFRLQSSMQGVTDLAGIGSVGGHVVVAVAGSEHPFRYRALDSVLMPAIFQPGQITGVTTNPDGTVNFTLHLHAESAPAILRVLPGQSQHRARLASTSRTRDWDTSTHREPRSRVLRYARRLRRTSQQLLLQITGSTFESTRRSWGQGSDWRVVPALVGGLRQNGVCGPFPSSSRETGR